MKEIIMKYRQKGSLTTIDYFCASGISGKTSSVLTYSAIFEFILSAGGLTALCTNPIWVVKTRMLSTSKDTPGAYRGIGQGITSIVRKEGLRGLYRGLLPSLFGVSHGAVQFAAYEKLKNYRARNRGDGSSLSSWDFLTLSALSKIFAGTVTYPYQVLRARMQTYDAQRTYKSVGDLLAQIIRKEGLKGFYKG